MVEVSDKKTEKCRTHNVQALTRFPNTDRRPPPSSRVNRWVATQAEYTVIQRDLRTREVSALRRIKNPNKHASNTFHESTNHEHAVKREDDAILSQGARALLTYKTLMSELFIEDTFNINREQCTHTLSKHSRDGRTIHRTQNL